MLTLPLHVLTQFGTLGNTFPTQVLIRIETCIQRLRSVWITCVKIVRLSAVVPPLTFDTHMLTLYWIVCGHHVWVGLFSADVLCI